MGAALTVLPEHREDSAGLWRGAHRTTPSASRKPVAGGLAPSAHCTLPATTQPLLISAVQEDPSSHTPTETLSPFPYLGGILRQDDVSTSLCVPGTVAMTIADPHTGGIRSPCCLGTGDTAVITQVHRHALYKVAFLSAALGTKLGIRVTRCARLSAAGCWDTATGPTTSTRCHRQLTFLRTACVVICSDLAAKLHARAAQTVKSRALAGDRARGTVGLPPAHPFLWGPCSPT